MTVAPDRQTFAAVSIKMIAALVRGRGARGLKSDGNALSPPAVYSHCECVTLYLERVNLNEGWARKFKVNYVTESVRSKGVCSQVFFSFRVRFSRVW